MKTIDLNCDIGEGLENDLRLMQIVSSVNIACGFHAGNPAIIRKTIDEAIQTGVAIGAHPGYPDRENFGRRSLDLPRREVFDSMLYQIAAVKGMCEALGGRLNHVKPHGALYNQAAKDPGLASVIAEAVQAIDRNLILYGLSGSFLITEAKKIGLHTVSEVFADRTYQSDGTLTPRSCTNALITDPLIAVAQVKGMIESGKVVSIEGNEVEINAETVCIHGDGPHAIEFAEAIAESLRKSGVNISAVTGRSSCRSDFSES